MGIHNVVGDLYHKHVYRHITRGTSGLTDSIDYAISDLLLGPLLYVNEICAGIFGLMAYGSIKSGKLKIS